MFHQLLVSLDGTDASLEALEALRMSRSPLPAP